MRLVIVQKMAGSIERMEVEASIADKGDKITLGVQAVFGVNGLTTRTTPSSQAPQRRVQLVYVSVGRIVSLFPSPVTPMITRTLARASAPLPAILARSLSSTAPRHFVLRNHDLTRLRPTTETDLAIYRERTPKGFTEAHGVAADIRPVAFDDIPPENSRGGRDVAGWRSLYEGTVGPHWANGHGTLHGGCAAWIVDNLTWRAVQSLGTKTWGGTGVSVTLDMTYQAPAPVGTRLKMLVTVDRMTGTVAYTRCEFFTETGDRIAGGNHVIMWRNTKKPPSS